MTDEISPYSTTVQRSTMTEKSAEPTHTPLYLGTPKDAVCTRHGEMVRKHTPLITINEHVYTTREGTALYACPECCIDLFAIAGEPNIDPKQALTHLWKQYLRDDWSVVSDHLFVDLGPGGVVPRDGRATVLFDEEPDEADMPEGFRSCGAWFVREDSSESGE